MYWSDQKSGAITMVPEHPDYLAQILADNMKTCVLLQEKLYFAFSYKKIWDTVWKLLQSASYNTKYLLRYIVGFLSNFYGDHFRICQCITKLNKSPRGFQFHHSVYLELFRVQFSGCLMNAFHLFVHYGDWIRRLVYQVIYETAVLFLYWVL